MNSNFSLSPGQMIAKFQRNVSQHCWAQHVTCDWPQCCEVLRHVGCCWLKFEAPAKRSQQFNATLLAHYLQAPAKRSQHFDATYRNIVGLNMLRAFGHHVATCCELKTELVRMPGCNIVARTWSNDYNIHKRCVKNFSIFKFEPTTPNMSQHIATRRNRVAKRAQHVAPNNVTIYCVEMLRSFGQGLKMVKFFMQHFWILHDVVVVWPGSCNNVAICYVEVLRSFGWSLQMLGQQCRDMLC